jgi:hypothetical protein
MRSLPLAASTPLLTAFQIIPPSRWSIDMGTFMKSLAAIMRSASTVKPQTTGLDTIRAEVSRLREERQSIADLPAPVGDLMAIIDKRLDEAAANAFDQNRIPTLSILINGDDHGHRGLYFSQEPRHLLNLMLALNRDSVRSMLEKEIARATANRTEMSREDKAAEFSRIDNRLGQAEAAEELTTRSLEAAGHDVVRRGDASPRIVLAYDDDLSKIVEGART